MREPLFPDLPRVSSLADGPWDAGAADTLVSLGCGAPLLRYGEKSITIDPCGGGSGRHGLAREPHTTPGEPLIGHYSPAS